MEVLKITDNPDGSATMDLKMSEEEQRLLIEYAVVNLLKEYIESGEEKSMKELIEDKEKESYPVK